MQKKKIKNPKKHVCKKIGKNNFLKNHAKKKATNNFLKNH